MKAESIFRTRMSLIALSLFFSLELLAANWQELSSGKHSFRQLGSAHYEEVPVKPIEGARLVLFNERAARQFGLEIPASRDALEKMILEQFAVVVDESGQSPKKLIATRYQDSKTKKPGDALGDGRAVWSGEFLHTSSSGQVFPIDVVLKGVGATPLAWRNHAEPSHSDGLQSMQEAISSFAYSEANFRNKLISTVDLAVIEIPIKKKEWNGELRKASITVRVGNQTRLAHLRYFVDDPPRFKKIFEYILRRDLGIPSSRKIKKKHVAQFMRTFAKNMGEEAARYYDLHAVHGSPTPGNRSSNASTIDMGTFRYLDGHHTGYTYLFDKYELQQQTDNMRSYIKQLNGYFEKARYSQRLDQSELGTVFSLFEASYKTALTDCWLTRLGLSREQKLRVPYLDKVKFTDAVKNLYESQDAKTLETTKGKIKVASFDVRKGLAQTAAFVASGNTNPAKLAEAFQSDAIWAQGPFDQKERQFIAEFLISSFKVLQPFAQDFEGIKRRATEVIAASPREGPNKDFFSGDAKYLAFTEVEKMVASEQSFDKIGAAMEKVIRRFSDRSLPNHDAENALSLEERNQDRTVKVPVGANQCQIDEILAFK